QHPRVRERTLGKRTDQRRRGSRRQIQPPSAIARTVELARFSQLSPQLTLTLRLASLLPFLAPGRRPYTSPSTVPWCRPLLPKHFLAPPRQRTQRRTSNRGDPAFRNVWREPWLRPSPCCWSPGQTC